METQTFIRLFARAKTRAIPEPLRTRARQSWMHRWGSLLACAAARGFASSLLEVVGAGQPGGDGEALQQTCWGTSPRRKARHHGSDAGLDVGSAGRDLTTVFLHSIP